MSNHRGRLDDTGSIPVRAAQRRVPSLAAAVLMALLAGAGSGRLQAADSETGTADISIYAIDQVRGYRMEHYRAPVPDTVPGGTRVDTTFVANHPAPEKSVLIDVFPPEGMGPDPLDGHWIITEARETLPGAVWLPEVGRGYLDAEREAYFRRNLDRLTRENPGLPLVFFCTADCWQSWNAAKRAADWGYTDVHWYADGTDGWREADRPVEAGRPLNFLDDSEPEPGELP